MLPKYVPHNFPENFMVGARENWPVYFSFIPTVVEILYLIKPFFCRLNGHVGPNRALGMPGVGEQAGHFCVNAP